MNFFYGLRHHDVALFACLQSGVMATAVQIMIQPVVNSVLNTPYFLRDFCRAEVRQLQKIKKDIFAG
jgi:hypothetical protein